MFDGDKGLLFNQETLDKINAPTPVEQLEKYKSTDGNLELVGVKWMYVQDKLNETFGQGMWGFKPDMSQGRFSKKDNKNFYCLPVSCCIYGYNFYKNEDDGAWQMSNRTILWESTHVGNSVGSQSSEGDMVKSAITDGIKKCFSTLGFFHDVYSGQIDVSKIPDKKYANKGDSRDVPRVGTCDVEDDEAKRLANNLWGIIKDTQDKLKEAAKNGTKLNKSQDKFSKLKKSDLFKIATVALRKSSVDNPDATGTLQSDIKMNESVKTITDIHTLAEWTIVKNYIHELIGQII